MGRLGMVGHGKLLISLVSVAPLLGTNRPPGPIRVCDPRRH
jgi:hypothetical protein